MLRTTRAIRRTNLHVHIRRHLHEDSRGDYLGFSPSVADPRFGMDMTRAPGYEVAAEEPSLVGNQKLVDFAARHARLSSSQIGQAQGYMWVGSVLYPTNLHPDYDMEAPWDSILDDEPQADNLGGEKAADSADVSRADAKETKTGEEEGLKANRRYTGGQARRIRKERERSAQKKALRRLRKRPSPVRKPENDIPEDVDS